MENLSTTEPPMAHYGSESDEGRPEEVPPAVGTTANGAAATVEAAGGSHGIGEAMAGSEELQSATTAAGEHGGARPVPQSAQIPMEISDPDRVSEIASVLSTSSSSHTVIDAPVSSSTLFAIDDVVLAAAGGSGGGDIGGSDVGDGGGLVHSGSIAEGSLVGGDIAGRDVGGTGRGGGVISGVDRGAGERILSLGGLDVLVGDDVVMEDLGTGERDGGDSLVSGVGGGVGGGSGDGLTPDVPTGEGPSRSDKGKRIATETTDIPPVTEETTSEVLREVEVEERERERQVRECRWWRWPDGHCW